MAKKDKHEELGPLLSAYLDGELTEAQIAKVQKRLAADPQARQQLAELREVTAWLGDVPRAQAPRGLAVNIQQGLERDLLLGEAHALGDLDGARHLRLRRFLAAAAMIALAIGLGAMVYVVLPQNGGTEPDRQALKEERPTVPPLHGEADGATAVGAHEEGIIVANGADRELPNVEISGADSEMVAWADIALPQLRPGSARLLVRTADHRAGRDAVDAFLAEHDVNNIVHRSMGETEHQYALLCSTEVLRKLYRKAAGFDSEGIDALVDDPATDAETVVRDITEEQVLTLATAVETDERVAFAERFQRENVARARAEEVVANRGTDDALGSADGPFFFESPYEMISRSPAPNSRAEVLVMGEPKLTNLQALGKGTLDANARPVPEDTLRELRRAGAAPAGISEKELEDMLIAVVLVLRSPAQAENIHGADPNSAVFLEDEAKAKGIADGPIEINEQDGLITTSTAALLDPNRE